MNHYRGLNGSAIDAAGEQLVRVMTAGSGGNSATIGRGGGPAGFAYAVGGAGGVAGVNGGRGDDGESGMGWDDTIDPRGRGGEGGSYDVADRLEMAVRVIIVAAGLTVVALIASLALAAVIVLRGSGLT